MKFIGIVTNQLTYLKNHRFDIDRSLSWHFILHSFSPLVNRTCNLDFNDVENVTINLSDSEDSEETNSIIFVTVFFLLLLVPISTCCPWSHRLRQLKQTLLFNVEVSPAPVRVSSQRPLAPSVASVTSVANDKGDTEMILGLCTDLLASSTRIPSDEGAVRPVITSNGDLSLQMRSVGSHSTSGREKKGKKGIISPI